MNGSISWSSIDITVNFGRHKIFVKPPTDRNDASLHMDLESSAIDEKAARSIFNQILSRCAWIEGAPAKLLFGWSGNPIPVAVPRYLGPSYLGLSRVVSWPYEFQPLPPEPTRVLAIYRLAVNLQSDGYTELSILNFYRLLETRYRDGIERGKWLEGALERALVLQRKRAAGDSLGSLPSKPNELALFIWESCRNAAAHAKSPDVNPDDAEASYEKSRLLRLMDHVARDFIVEHFQISEDRWSAP